MTIDEFNEFRWCPGYEAKYQWRCYSITSVDFEEKLIGLDQDGGIKWVRCENVSVEYPKPEESVWPHQKGGR